MTRYKRLAESYDEAKALIDYARTLTTFFGLAAIAGVTLKAQYVTSSKPPSSGFFDVLISVSTGLFVLLVLALWTICSRLTYKLFMDLFAPAAIEPKGVWLTIWKVSVWIVSYMVMAGAAGIVWAAISTAMT